MPDSPVQNSSSAATLRVDAARLNRFLLELGHIGETPDGLRRIAFSPAEIEARALVTRTMREAGLEVRVDACANLIGSRAGTVPGLGPVATGSHVDAVPLGGKFDGALGVAGALEAARTLHEAKRALRHPLEILVFTNEEGARFHRGLMGSRAMAGLLQEGDLTARDDEGRTLADHLPAAGGDGTRLAQAVRPPGSLAGYFELHIEQGPILHETGVQIGVVTGITGRVALRARITGFANHAGTTPMERRRDALVAASRLVLAAREIAAREKLCRVGTAGVLNAHPGAVNVIPGSCLLEVEFRDLEDGRVDSALERLRRIAQHVAGEERVEIEIEAGDREHGTPTDARFRDFITRAADGLGLSSREMESGASHDAQSMARLGPIGMIFVPSVGGVSHAKSEYTPPEDCARGAEVLLRALLLADAELA
jgi:N-carbamoyl-L-amino-acid hydrolase